MIVGWLARVRRSAAPPRCAGAQGARFDRRRGRRRQLPRRSKPPSPRSADARHVTLRRWNSGANAATPQNPDSDSDYGKPQHEAHSANAMRVETMASERHECRATLAR